MRKRPGKTFHNHTMSFTDETWEKLGQLSKSMEISRSALITIMVNNLERVERLPVGQLVMEIIKDIQEDKT